MNVMIEPDGSRQPMVIVPLDGSPRAESALRTAQALAGGAPLMVVTTKWDGDAVAPQEYLARIVESTPGDAVDALVVFDRGPADAILAVAQDHPESIICMATRGRGGRVGAVLGSVAEEVVRGSPNPVALVGPRAHEQPVVASGIVVAVDTVKTATGITPFAASVAQRLGAGVSVVEVVAPAPMPFAPAEGAVEWPEQTDAAMVAVAALAGSEVPAEAHILRDVEPGRAILGFLRGHPASFVIVGTHARHRLASAVLGSVVMDLTHRATCPVIVVRS